MSTKAHALSVSDQPWPAALARGPLPRPLTAQLTDDPNEATVGTCHPTADDPEDWRLHIFAPLIRYGGHGHMPLTSGPMQGKPGQAHPLAWRGLIR